MPRNPEKDISSREPPPKPNPEASPGEWAEYVLLSYEADGITQMRHRYSLMLEKYADQPEVIAKLQALAKKDPIAFSSVLRDTPLK